MQGNGDVVRPAALLEKQPSQAEDEDSDDAGSSSSDSDEDSLSPEERRLRENTQKDSGTAGKESEAGAEISALVNYVQPGHFKSFAEAEREWSGGGGAVWGGGCLMWLAVGEVNVRGPLR